MNPVYYVFTRIVSGPYAGWTSHPYRVRANAKRAYTMFRRSRGAGNVLSPV